MSEHVCPKCGWPQPLDRQSSDYFSFLGFPRKFGFTEHDLSKLQENFYAVSRSLHPDRFTALSTQTQLLSLDRMGFLNQAYSTLKSQESRRSYLLQLEGFSTQESQKSGTSDIPKKIVEDWFELQELLMDDPQRAQRQLSSFMAELESARRGVLEQIASCEKSYDQNPNQDPLKAMGSSIRALNYLDSLKREVERKVFHANSA